VCLCQCLCVRYLGTITTTLSGAEERTYADSTAGRFLGRGGERRGDRYGSRRMQLEENADRINLSGKRTKCAFTQ
jgi:hypothetical protein